MTWFEIAFAIYLFGGALLWNFSGGPEECANEGIRRGWSFNKTWACTLVLVCFWPGVFLVKPEDKE